MKPWEHVEEMISDETVKAKLIEWAVKFADGKSDFVSVERACKSVCDTWQRAIVQPVMDRLERQPEWAIGIKQHDLDQGVVDCEVKLVTATSMKAVIKRYGLEPDEEGNYRITDTMVDEAEALDKEMGVEFRTVLRH